MHLFILTNATDPALAAVTSVTDDTVLSDVGQLVLGDKVPMVVDFTDGSAAPAWASDETYTLEVALGVTDSAERFNLAATSSFTLSTATRTGTLDLSADALRRFVDRSPWCRRRTIVAMDLQVRVTTPAGEVITYALLPVVLRLSVL